MTGLHFEYKAIRAKKARLSLKINGLILILCYLIFIVLLMLSGFLIFNDEKIGYLLLSAMFIDAIFIQWYNGELKSLKKSRKINTIGDLISLDVLGKISKRPNPKELASIVGTTKAGNFFCVRFGISPRFLQDISSDDPNDLAAVWDEAYGLYLQTKSAEISAAVIIVALIRLAPDYLTPLGHLQLDVEDLESGIDWFNYLNELVDSQKRRVLSGGIARDWSFGWTPMLDRFGVNLSNNSGRLSSIKLDTHEDAIDKIVTIFSKRGRQNAVLVGPSGAGKSEIVKSFSNRIMDSESIIPSELRYRQVITLDASSIISAAKNDSVESIVIKLFNEAYAAKNIIIFLDNAHLFFENSIGSVDISNILMPIISSGSLRIILSIGEQELIRISARNPELVNLFNRIVISIPTKDETIKIMQHKSIFIEYQHSVVFMYQALAEAYRLSDRYIYDLAMPGKAINLLESSAAYSENGLVTASSIRQTIEKTMNIKVGSADNSERDKLANLEALIHERLVGQDHAVTAVSDALRRARLGVSSNSRPIGTFMFMGPTGVGKTELAKALAAIYFGGEESIIRLDMNEFSNPEDNVRLIQDASVNANSLTAQVMKRPFSVVLFDEIEKAHQSTVLTLLQMLDEGVLRDENNREISFKDTIIIATSNAGADRIREYIDRGYDVTQFEDKFMDELISSNIFKPEFLNRFDEIVMFKPLTKNELLNVADIIIESINKTLSVQKISVGIESDAKLYLIEQSYNPKHGARQVRRTIQRSVENIIASKMLANEIMPGSTLQITLDQVKQTSPSSVISGDDKAI